MMVEEAFVQLVAQMREAQKAARFWRERQWWIAAAQYERAVDVALLRLRNEVVVRREGEEQDA